MRSRIEAVKPNRPCRSTLSPRPVSASLIFFNRPAQTPGLLTLNPEQLESLKTSSLSVEAPKVGHPRASLLPKSNVMGNSRARLSLIRCRVLGFGLFFPVSNSLVFTITLKPQEPRAHRTKPPRQLSSLKAVEELITGFFWRFIGFYQGLWILEGFRA